MAGSVECASPARDPSSLKIKRRVQLPDDNMHIRDNWNNKYKHMTPPGTSITVDVSEQDTAASVVTSRYKNTRVVGYDANHVRQTFKNIPTTTSSGTVNISYKFADIERSLKIKKNFERVTWMNNNRTIIDSTYADDIIITGKYAGGEDYDYLSAYNFHYGIDNKSDSEKIDQMKEKRLIRNSARAFTGSGFLDYDEESVFYPKKYVNTLPMQNNPYVSQGNQNGQPYPPDNGNKVWRVSYNNAEYTFSSTLKDPVVAIWSLGQPQWNVQFRVLTRTVSPSGRIDYKKVNLVSIDKGANQRLNVSNTSGTHGVYGKEAYGQFMCKGEYDNLIFDADGAEHYWNVMIGTHVQEQ